MADWLGPSGSYRAPAPAPYAELIDRMLTYGESGYEPAQRLCAGGHASLTVEVRRHPKAKHLLVYINAEGETVLTSYLVADAHEVWFWTEHFPGLVRMVEAAAQVRVARASLPPAGLDDEYTSERAFWMDRPDRQKRMAELTVEALARAWERAA